MLKTKLKTPVKLLLLIYWVLCFALTHLHLPSAVAPQPGMDKVYHFVGYFILGFLLKTHFMFQGKFTRHQVRAGLTWIAVYSLFDESTQPFFGRQFDMLDMAADLAGATLGTWLSRRIFPEK